jgi:NADH dehydrogenase/NADH:ubiquinone oxidoreductase subunit G
MTNEEAALAKTLFDRLKATVGVMVDPIGPIKMKSRTEWLLGTQGGPNYRGVSAILSGDIENLLTRGADGIDVLYICDAEFSDRAKDPAVIANLRKAKFLIVHSWDANHPLNEVADVLLPSTIHAEKNGTFTNLQGRVQRINEAYPPKGQAAADLEIFRRVGAKLFPTASEFRVAAVEDFESAEAVAT